MKFSNMTAFRQYGAALPVALVMLLISTMIGLASIRSATEQAKMSSNMYDRSLAYQAAEAALYAAEKAITELTFKNRKIFKANCLNQDDHKELDTNETYVENDCPPIPANTFSSVGSENWENVTLNIKDDKEFLITGLAPQYYIERMALIEIPGLDADSPNCANYPYCPLVKALLYRITARSGVPSKENNRSIVVLQMTATSNI
ncbi:MAG: PilX N-terminal domain-containing pilus assembly protein [Pseudomonas sp.]|nr:PilX N-terminal domain-containing pilus assembly protein [Pseudomonas sp.]